MERKDIKAHQSRESTMVVEKTTLGTEFQHEQTNNISSYQHQCLVYAGNTSHYSKQISRQLNELYLLHK